MDGTRMTPQERDANLDRLVARFIADNAVLRGFDIDGPGYSALIDSRTTDDGVTFVWTGWWSEQPSGLEAPALEIVVADTFDGLREHHDDGAAVYGVASRLRSVSGFETAMRPVLAPGYRCAWVGSVDGAAVGVFSRTELETGVVVAELDDVRPVIARWRDMVDRVSARARTA